MKVFEKDMQAVAQGDVLIRRIDKIPEGVELVNNNDQVGVIIAHSETQHHHIMRPHVPDSVFLYSTKDELVSYLKVEKPATLEHHRSFDTHEEILFDVGLFEIRRQRESVPEGFRRVTD